MKIWTLIIGLSLLTFLVVFTSCEKNNEPTDFGILSGNAFYSGCTIPISGVTISLADKNTTTGQDGKFNLSNVPVGTHTLEARKSDYDSYYIEVTIVKNSSTAVDVMMTSQRFTSIVFGIVKDQDGKAISGAIVVILNPDNSESELRTTTSATGYYQLLTVPQGERALVVKKSNYQTVQSSIFIVDRDYEFDIRISEATVDCIDPNGRSYKTIQIGGQIWMAENLAYLPAVSPPGTGSDTEKHYYVWGYNGTNVTDAKKEANYTTYGVLYNWPAVMNGANSSNSVPSGVQGICPQGWHLPSDAEWKVLEKYLGMNESDADNTLSRSSGSVGGKLKEAGTSHWITPNTGANNSSGFTALPGGGRFDVGGFDHLGNYTYFWSSTEDGSSKAWYRRLNYFHDGVYRDYYFRRSGFSVRCLKNE